MIIHISNTPPPPQPTKKTSSELCSLWKQVKSLRGRWKARQRERTDRGKERGEKDKRHSSTAIGNTGSVSINWCAFGRIRRDTARHADSQVKVSSTESFHTLPQLCGSATNWLHSWPFATSKFHWWAVHFTTRPSVTSSLVHPKWIRLIIPSTCEFRRFFIKLLISPPKLQWAPNMPNKLCIHTVP